MARRYLALAALLVGLAVCAHASATMPEPFWPSGNEPAHAFYGDADNIRLLAGLLGDDDPSVRELAVRNLGETGNALAISHLRAAMKDDSAAVRIAAVIAAEELNVPESPDLVRQGLRDADADVRTQSAGAAGRMKLSAAKPELVAMLGNPDALVREAALYAMTRANLPADAAKLQTLLMDKDCLVRLRAAENAALVDQTPELVGELVRLADTDVPTVREAAVAALGKFAPTDAAIDRAARDVNPLVRRGALRAYACARSAEKIRPFLDDASPLVISAAVEAAGKLKAADCVQRLFEIMLATGDDGLRRLAADSLRQIGTPAAAEQAGEALRRLTPQLLSFYAASRPVTSRPNQILKSNASACCRLLGELKSKAGYESMQELFSKLPVDSEVLAEIAPAMAKIGDTQVVPAMVKMLQTCAVNGQLALQAMLGGNPPPKPWNENVACALVEALARFKAAEALPGMINLAKVQAGGIRLSKAPAVVARALPALLNSENRPAIEKFFVDVLDNPSYYDEARFEAFKAAGRLQLAAARPAMERMLHTGRSSKLMILAAAWALRELTGQSPALPEPIARQGDWIIRRAK